MTLKLYRSVKVIHVLGIQLDLLSRLHWIRAFQVTQTHALGAAVAALKESLVGLAGIPSVAEDERQLKAALVDL